MLQENYATKNIIDNMMKHDEMEKKKTYSFIQYKKKHIEMMNIYLFHTR